MKKKCWETSEEKMLDKSYIPTDHKTIQWYKFPFSLSSWGDCCDCSCSQPAAAKANKSSDSAANRAAMLCSYSRSISTD